MKEFKKGDKIRVIRDFKERGSQRDNIEGVFVEYLTENSRYSQAYMGGYRYIVDVPDGRGLVCYDIEHLNMKKYKFSDVVSENSNIWVKCYNEEQALKIKGGGGFMNPHYPIVVWRAGEYITCSKNEWNQWETRGNVFIIDYNEIDFEEFVLPEKWVIKGTFENLPVVGEWFNKNKQNNFDETYTQNRFWKHDNYLHYPYWGERNHGHLTIQPGYTEITFEQFLKYVLKQKTMEKKIIGYKCPTNLYDGSLLKNTILTEKHRCGNGKEYKYSDSGFTCFMPKEIVEAWEPVYENILPDVTLFRHKAEKTTDGVKFGCKNFTRAELSAYWKLVEIGDSEGFTVTIGTITLTKKILEDIGKIANS